MSDAPFGGLTPAPGTPQPNTGMTHAASTPIAPPPWPPQGPPPARRPSRLPLVLVSLLAVAALAVAIASWFRPAPAEDESAAPQYSEQEIADATEAVCGAWDTAYGALRATGTKSSDDPTAAYLLAIESQLAFHAAGEHLNASLQTNPATPEELEGSASDLAAAYRDVALAQLADAPDSEIDKIKLRMGSAEEGVRQACE